MSTVRQGAPGATRTCPHCRTSILESSAVCPSCRHHLRFDPTAAGAEPVPSFQALAVEGTIRQSETGQPWEYSMLLSIRNAKGEEISRQVVGVGAITPGDERTFSLAVEVFKPAEGRIPGRGR